ncbi:MAG: hypothetical protein H6867_04750 [Rhodospirillales bacterium]|nr:hypothetical protein [Rhodospirillales bacterium]MCB9994810.1 hypothetical protein [Rhodospirillales bacterium]
MSESQGLLQLLKELITGVVKEIGILEGRLTASEKNMENMEERHMTRMASLQHEMQEGFRAVNENQQETNKALARLEGRTIGSVKTLVFVVTVSSGIAGTIAALITILSKMGFF